MSIAFLLLFGQKGVDREKVRAAEDMLSSENLMPSLHSFILRAGLQVSTGGGDGLFQMSGGPTSMLSVF